MNNNNDDDDDDDDDDNEISDDEDDDYKMMMTMTIMIAELNSRASVAPYLGKCGNLPIREILVIT